ncbi:protein Red-like isoform X2 [Limulus polyphemus]|uniref:Protein Red-like isoform X2 n=1 Tax=Limulus polyphemus TaxID=6850 RepID=A0ABM1T2U1_LIMPO|nr:protein Red-like isoform X2 [Limulus polyphemus]
MPERDNEPFSNPLPPAGLDLRRAEEADIHPMTNDDFRKLLMTPRVPPPSAPPTAEPEVYREEPKESDKAEKRKNKKKYYADLKKQEEDKLAELSRKYRDRAKERREGNAEDYQSEDPISSTAGYRAVAPDVKSGMDAAERRRQMIQESKFLGGDMEHTHLVKGLDYALLQKVRSEITSKEKEEEEMEKVIMKTTIKDEEDMQFKTRMGRNLYRLLFRGYQVEKNDLFLPGRMAYVIDLEDEYAESDIPTTRLRSKADCPIIETQTTLTTNDIVINKLTQILSYLRQGPHHRKGKKKEKIKLRDDEKAHGKMGDESIYGDIGDYMPTLDRKEKDKYSSRERNRDKTTEKDKERKRTYFEKPNVEDDREKDRENKREHSTSEQVTNWGGEVKVIKPEKTNDNMERNASGRKAEDNRLRAKLSSKLEREIPESYAECYPGAPEYDDALDDSDDEVDYSKMDMGNKKGPIGRWDFDTQEEYSEYMSNKEALPKAAFQYGVKMADGRKTRRLATGKKDEKTKLDRELQKINQIISKRKAAETEALVAGMGTPDVKRSRY